MILMVMCVPFLVWPVLWLQTRSQKPEVKGQKETELLRIPRGRLASVLR